MGPTSGFRDVSFALCCHDDLKRMPSQRAENETRCHGHEVGAYTRSVVTYPSGDYHSRHGSSGSSRTPRVPSISTSQGMLSPIFFPTLGAAKPSIMRMDGRPQSSHEFQHLSSTKFHQRYFLIPGGSITYGLAPTPEINRPRLYAWRNYTPFQTEFLCVFRSGR